MNDLKHGAVSNSEQIQNIVDLISLIDEPI